MFLRADALDKGILSEVGVIAASVWQAQSS